MSDILFPTATTGVTPATGDIILIADVSDSNNPKDCTLAELPISTATQNALNAKQGGITLTTTGTSGPATLISDTLNIPQYTGGGGTPGGADTQIQFNDGGAFGGSANLTFDKTTGLATQNGGFSVIGGTGLSGNGGGQILVAGTDDSAYGPGYAGITGGNSVDGSNGGGVEFSGGAGSLGGNGGEGLISGGKGGDFGDGGNIYQFGGEGGDVYGNGGNTTNYGGFKSNSSYYGDGGNAENYGGDGTNGGSVGGYGGDGDINGGMVGMFGGNGFIGGDIYFGAGESVNIGDVGLAVSNINNGGTGYTIFDAITVDGGSACEIVVTNVGGSGEVTDWTQRYYGYGYIAGGTGLTTTGGSGTGFTVDAILTPARHGKVYLNSVNPNSDVELDTSILTDHRVATFQDANGTLAFLSDITGGLQLPTYTVGAVGTDYPGFTDTAIQSALDAGNGKIFLTDGTYVLSTGLKYKSNYQYIEGNGEKCIIQFDGATVPTAISPNAINLKQGGIKGVSIQQTNATIQGTALDLSDMAIMDVDVEIKDAGVAVKMNDANNNTFYNRVNIRAFGCIRGIELNGANPANHNYFSGRIANKSGGDYGIYIVKGQGNSFKDISLEPVATTGNTGIYLTSASAYANTFENVWIEGNANGVTIDSTVTYNSFIGGTVTANTTNRTDNGKNTVWFNTQVGSVALTVLQPFIATDTGNASSTVSTIQNNTSFAHTGGKLVAIELLNGSDSSKVLELKNSGTGKTLSIMQGTSEVASIAPGGDLMTLSTIDVGHESDTTLSRVSAGVIAVEGVTVPTISSTDTLTNKRNQPRVVSATSYTTDTGTSLDVSTCDIFIVTAQAGALLFNAPSGTPVQGEKLIIRIKDNGTSRTLTYNAIYRAIGVTLPTATTISKTTYIGLVYNSTDTKWDCIAVSTEA